MTVMTGSNTTPYHGVPKVLVSDPGSGFGSDVMKYIRKVVGIKDHDFAAPRAKGKVAAVERTHRGLREVLADGFSKGDICDRKSYRIYLSVAMQKANQFASAGRVSPVELWSGQRVRNMQSLALVGGEVEAEQMPAGEDQVFAAKLKGLVGELVEYEHHLRDDVARKNALRKDKEDQVTLGSHAQNFEMSVGDMVSMEGRSCKILELHGEPGRPVTATILDRGKERRVLKEELRPRAAAMPVKMLPKVVEIGGFVLWKDTEGYLCGGTMIANLPGNGLEVWAREQDTGMGKSWMPTWKSDAGKVVKAGMKPGGMEKNTVVVDEEVVVLTGELTDTHRMSEQTWRAAVALDLM
jgi:hypothetical protein